MNQKNRKLQRCEIFQRFIDNRYSVEDVEYIFKCIHEPDTDKSLTRTCQDSWYYHFDKSIVTEDKTDFETILDRVHHKINLADNKPLSAGSISLARKILISSMNVFYRVAAIIVISALIVGLTYYIRNERFIPDNKLTYSEIIAPLGSRIKVDLPDGSTAWLNQGTILKYSQKFGKQSRELSLTGEAYFKVKEDKKHPFILNTSDIDILVLGTSFNVMAYEDDPNIEVTLEEGKLDLYYSSSMDKPSGKIGTLIPGEHLVIGRNSKKVSKYSGETDIYTDWKDGIMIFRDAPLDVIVKKLERWYNVEVELANKELAKYKFTATFTDETLPQVLHLLSVAVPMDYTITSRIKQADNIFSKNKVILKLKNKE